MKIRVYANLILIWGLFSSGIFSFVMVTRSVHKQVVGPISIESKFEPGLWEKVQELQANGTMRSLDVVVYINCTLHQANITDGYHFRQHVADLLVQDHNVTIVNVATVLSFIHAEINVTEIEKIATYGFVEVLGDGDATGSGCLDLSTAINKVEFRRR